MTVKAQLQSLFAAFWWEFGSRDAARKPRACTLHGQGVLRPRDGGALEGGAGRLGCRRQPSHQGVAKEGDDPNVVAATMSRPGVVFKRPAGSNRRFAEHSDLPSELGIQRERDSAEKASPRSRRSDARPRSASGMPESPPPISRRSRSAATPSAGAKRPPGKGGQRRGELQRRGPANCRE